MDRTTLFIGLTREVTFAGLPLNFLISLIGITMFGFILTTSIVYLIGVGGSGYLVLRTLAAFDSKIIGVIFATLKSTMMSHALFTKEGLTYHA